MNTHSVTMIQAPTGYQLLQCVDGSLMPLSSLNDNQVISKTLKRSASGKMAPTLAKVAMDNKPLDLTKKIDEDDQCLTIVIPTSPPQSPVHKASTNTTLSLYTPMKYTSRLSELPPELITAVEHFRPCFPSQGASESIFSAESNFTCDGILFCGNREARRERQKKVKNLALNH